MNCKKCGNSRFLIKDFRKENTDETGLNFIFICNICGKRHKIYE